MELLAPICNREKKWHPQPQIFPLQVSLPDLDGDGEKLSSEAFLS